VASRASSIFTGGGLDSTFCGHCDRKVEVLTGKSLLEVAAFMKANPGTCIVIGGKLGQRTDRQADWHARPCMSSLSATLTFDFLQ
jgi:hypothetical protein